MEDTVAGAAGIPYKSCKQVGVMILSQLAGIASDVGVPPAVELGIGTENTGRPPKGLLKLGNYYSA